jgi:hypothetical protein
MRIILSKSEYGRLHHVAPATVRTWVYRGHLTPPALRSDGMIDVALADGQLRVRLDALKSTGKGGGPRELFQPMPERTGAEEKAADDEKPNNGGEFNQLRIRRLRLEVEEKERNAAIARGELLPAAQLDAIWGQELRELVQAVEQWLPELAVKLGGDRGMINLIRAEWRLFRQRQADSLDLKPEPADAQHD